MAVEKTTTYNKYAHLAPDDNGEEEKGGGVMMGSGGGGGFPLGRGSGGPPPDFSMLGGNPTSDFGRGAPPDTRRGAYHTSGGRGGGGFPNHTASTGGGGGFGSGGGGGFSSSDSGNGGRSTGGFGGNMYHHPPPPPQGSGVFYVMGEDGGDRNHVMEDGFSNSTSEQAYTEKELEYFFTPVEVPPNHHKLQSQYCIWYSTRGYGKQANRHNFHQNLKPIGKFGSVEQFWSLYSHLVRPGELSNLPDVHLRRQVSSFHVFKMGIKPMWEDPANKHGGKWMFKIRKGLSSRCWENLVLAMLGEQFMVGDEICGAVISVRIQDDLISVWNRSAQDVAVTARIRDTFRRVLNLPPHTAIEYEYRVHADSIKKETRVP